MNNKNIIEIFTADAIILAAMFIFGFFDLGEIGIVFSAGALSFIMLRGNLFSVALSVVLVFAADFASMLSFNFINSITVCMCAFGINFAIRAKMGILSTTVSGIVGIFAAIAVFFAVAEIFKIEGMQISDIRAIKEEIIKVIDNIMVQSGFDKAYSPTEAVKLKNLASMVMFPVSLISVAAFISYYSVCVVKKMFKIVKSDLCANISDFSHIRAERMCLAIWIVSLALFSGFEMKNQVISAAGFCMLYILSAFYVICGISILWYFMKRKTGVGRVLYGMFIIFGVFFMTPTLFIAGIVDSFVNIRKLGNRRGENEQ